ALLNGGEIVGREMGRVGTPAELDARIRDALNDAPYRAIVACPDAWGYAERLAVLRDWARGASNARLVGVSQAAALGDARRTSPRGGVVGRLRGDRRVLYVVSGRAHLSTCVVERSAEVTDVVESDGVVGADLDPKTAVELARRAVEASRIQPAELVLVEEDV